MWNAFSTHDNKRFLITGTGRVTDRCHVIGSTIMRGASHAIGRFRHRGFHLGHGSAIVDCKDSPINGSIQGVM